MTSVKTMVIAGYMPYQITQSQILGLCNINEWWKRHRSHTLARLGCIFLCHVTCLRPHRRGGHCTNILTVVTKWSQWSSKLYLQKNNYVQPAPPTHPPHPSSRTCTIRHIKTGTVCVSSYGDPPPPPPPPQYLLSRAYADVYFARSYI